MKDGGAFRDFLKQRGLRLTSEREAILMEVFATKGQHFEPEELHISLRQKEANVSRASVYRTIPLLIEAGIIEEVERVDKHAHYELIHGREHHDHMLCLGCGSVIEFLSPEMEELQDRLCREHEFTGETHTLEIKGYCKKCADTK
jgi:Fur family ferric uptake transcriptional regulator